MSSNEIFNMGGYGVYVWSAYSLALFVFGMNLYLVMSEKRKVKKMIAQSKK